MRPFPQLLSLLLPLAACTALGNAQYDDRAGELEEARVDFLPSTDKVDMLTARENRVFWVSIEKPLDEPLMHSLDPATGSRIDYEFTRKDTRIADNYTLGNKLIVSCGFSTAKAFDATQSNRLIAMTSMASDTCAVDGTDVYFFGNRKIRKWTPGAGEPVDYVDLEALKVGTGTVDGFGVLGSQLLLAEGGRLWLLDLAAHTATWLENDSSLAGSVTFDPEGALFRGGRGPTYIQFADHRQSLLEDLIADGGYHLNIHNEDIQNFSDSGDDLSIYKSWVIYRGQRGIFAYGLETKKVVDILLDRGESFDATPVYHSPTVTSNGTLFVQDKSSIGEDSRVVYRVDLSERLK